MGSFFVDNAPPTNTGVTGGMSGGFQPQGPYSTMNDPPVTTQPQPYQQGPGGFDPQNPPPGWRPSVDAGGYIPTDSQRAGEQQQMADMFQKMGFKPQPGPYGRSWEPSGGGQGTLGQIGQHGGFFGGIANAMQSPNMQQVLQQAGARRGGGFWGPLRGAVQSMARPSFGQTLMNAGGQPQGNGMPTGWAPASQAGPMFQQPRPQPMNPSQQSGQVQMQSPDGQHLQYVNQEHVPHYQGLGATVVNGSSYGGGNG